MLERISCFIFFVIIEYKNKKNTEAQNFPVIPTEISEEFLVI